MSFKSTADMDACALDKLFSRNVPHILEKIFFSLDYESYKKCYEVSHTWNEILTSEQYLRIGKSVFQEEISEDETKLSIAIEKGDAAKVKRILSTRMLDINKKCQSGWAPLYAAVVFGHKEIVQLLLERGAEVNAKSRIGWTPLHCAAGKGYSDFVKILLDKGAIPNTKDNYERTPLFIAECNGQVAIANILKNYMSKKSK